MTLFSLYAFIWGAIWGSFLNVVIYRLPRGLSLVRPGSRCPVCETPIRWTENIPLVSYWVLRRRCRHCGAPISIRYFAVEALTATLSLMLFLKCAEGRLEAGQIWAIALPFLFYFYFICAAIAIAFIDYELTVVPDAVTLPSAVLGVIAAAVIPKGGALADFHPHPTWIDSLIGLAVGAGVVLGIGWLYRRMTGRVGMGGGDATTLAMVGAFLGWQSLLFVLFFASAQGVLFAVGAAVLERVRGRRGTFLLRGVHDPSFWEEPRMNSDGEEPRMNSDGEEPRMNADEREWGEEGEAPAEPAPSRASQQGERRARPERSDGRAGREPQASAEQGRSEATAERSEPAGRAPSSASRAAASAEPDVTFGKTGVPFGPFIALAAVEYLFLGEIAERWFLGGL